MNAKVFFMLVGVAVALPAPDKPVTSYGVPAASHESSSFEHFSPASASFEHSGQDSDSFEHFSAASASFEHSGQDSASFESYRPSSASDSGSDSYESYESSEAKYEFEWSVEDASTGNDFDHKEARDGDYTQGVYSVQLSDGRKQTVNYVVEGNKGYVADVQYEGEARYPDSFSRESYESRSYESRSHESFESSHSGSGSAESFESVYAPPPSTSYSAPDSNESK
ncbi:pro-resilin-like [Portunus trituberculatus]|uniref:pro-resilin-like n=1 Tax=Portunus trituberculatus TaxID=210409 RepID=UPI001E1CBBFA|nr:pro-resilin-like [Portunus trituberculatus]